MISVSVQAEDFNLGAEVSALQNSHTDVGAIVTFTGTVRDLTGDLETLELEHYPGMTEAELTRISEEAAARWPIKAGRVIHRYGRLSPGDNIVLVITLSAHRAAAFEAAQFLMDYLKTSAPFWKKETTKKGTKWVDAADKDDVAAKRWHT